MKYRGFLLATTGSLAAAGGAQAADLPLKSGPVPVAAPLWAGAYAGLHAGAYWGHSDVSGAAYGVGSVSNTGFIGGGQIGYNWQYGNKVLGVEADVSGLTGKATAEHGDGQAIRKDISTRINWLATFRGRAGLAVTDTLLYVTAGVAVGGVKNTVNAIGDTKSVYSESKTRVGWVVGGGVEQMWGPNWTVGLEGLFVDLGRSSIVGTASSNKTTKFSNQAIIGRVKLNYKW